MDRGIKSLAVVADAGRPGKDVPDEMDVLHVTEGVSVLQHAQKALRRANKALARTKKGSNGRRKARERLTKVHARVAHLPKEASHRLSHWCATHLSELTIETLNVKGMLQLDNLAKAISDAAMGEVGNQLRYKCRWYGVTLHEADRWFPSSKMCSHCGAVKKTLSLSERAYRCDGTGLPDGRTGCALALDRDVNAAINLARWPLLHSPEAKAALAALTTAASSTTKPPPLPEAA
jgi:putative transposase